MLERIVEGWLTNAGERGPFERAFTQLLAIEGCRILHAPVHHPYEHGKDIAAYAPDGGLYAYQLKGGDIGQGELEKLQGQLIALAGTAVSYPGVEPPRRPDRVFLVTSGRLSAPARDRLAAFNTSHRELHLPPIEVVERDQLVARFVQAHGKYLPTDVAHLDALLNLLVSDGRGPFPVNRWAAFVSATVGAAAGSGGNELGRAIASAMLLASYVAGPWQRLENHLGAAEAWLSTMFCILHAAAGADLKESLWQLSFELCRDAARVELRAALEEAAAAQDLVVPDLADGLVYGTRALIVLGYCSAFFIAESALGDSTQFAEPLRTLLLREVSYVRVSGEAAAGHLLAIANAFQLLGDYSNAGRLMMMWGRGVADTNSGRRGHDEGKALPDPYHSLEESLLRRLGADTENALESFAGHAYTLHVTVEWFARREVRTPVDRLWPAISRTTLLEFRPASPIDILSHHTEEGELVQWVPPITGSWNAIREHAQRVGELDLPNVLWRNIDTIAYLPLLFPHRLTSTVAKAIDYIVEASLVNVKTDESSMTDVAAWKPR